LPSYIPPFRFVFLPSFIREAGIAQSV
jgi:hypothetical protein